MTQETELLTELRNKNKLEMTTHLHEKWRHKHGCCCHVIVHQN